MSKQLVSTPFQQGWQYRVEIAGQPMDFDIYCKDITYGAYTIEYEGKEIGGQSFQLPKGKTAGLVTITVRDHTDARVEKFFTAAAKKVINPDGTINLPHEYLMTIKLYYLQSDGKEVLAHEWEASPAECGEITRSRSSLSEFVSFPISFQKYRAFGKKE
ncbi:MAG: hypothetical protein ACRC9V_10500 [Aeromonas sp.]